jgi:NADPH:quinone reductase
MNTSAAGPEARVQRNGSARNGGKMKAVRVRATGGREALELCELPDPAPDKDEVLVQVRISGVNFIDVYYREGKYKAPLPFTPGLEGAGYVEALGEGVSEFAIGDAVVWFGLLGSYAEKAVVPALRLVKVPTEMPLDISAALMAQGLMAYALSHLTFALLPGHTCLVHAAAGGVGSLLTQMAKSAGAKVIATVSNEQKAELARDAGADEVILYTQTDFYEAVMNMTNRAGVEVVYDGVGVATFEQSLKCLRPRGLLALYGAASGPVPPFDLGRLFQMGSLYITRPNNLDYVRTREELTSNVYALFKMYQEGQLKVQVNPPYALADVAKAHMDLESRKSTGKLLLAICD